jgi:hypothetical protein
MFEVIYHHESKILFFLVTSFFSATNPYPVVRTGRRNPAYPWECRVRTWRPRQAVPWSWGNLIRKDGPKSDKDSTQNRTLIKMVVSIISLLQMAKTREKMNLTSQSIWAANVCPRRTSNLTSKNQHLPLVIYPWHWRIPAFERIIIHYQGTFSDFPLPQLSRGSI